MAKLPDSWLTKDRQLLRIAEMDTLHIVNCVRMIRRNMTRRIADYGSDIDLLFGSIPNGEMAQMAWEHELIDVSQRHISDQYIGKFLKHDYLKAFNHELKRRGVYLAEDGKERV